MKRACFWFSLAIVWGCGGVSQPRAPLATGDAPRAPSPARAGIDAEHAPCNGLSTGVLPDPTSESGSGYYTAAGLVPMLAPRIVHAVWGPQLDRFVVADVARGVRVVDMREPRAPSIGPQLPLHAHPVELRVFGDRALLLLEHAQQLKSTHELWWLSLSRAEAPRVLQRAALDHVRGLFAVDGTTERARVVVVQDEASGDSCVHRSGTYLSALELSDAGIAQRERLALGPRVVSVWRSGGWLAVSEQLARPLDDHSHALRFVSLGTQRLERSAPHPVSDSVHAFDAQADVLRVVSLRAAVHGEGQLHRFEQRARVETLRVVAGAIARDHDCSYARSSSPRANSADLIDPLSIDQVTFRPDHALLALRERDDKSERVVVLDSARCALGELRSEALLALSDGRRIVGLSPAEGRELALHVHGAAPALEARVALAAPVANTAEGAQHNAYHARDARSHALPRGELLAVPLEEIDAQGFMHRGVQLFDVAADGAIAPGVKLDGALWRVAPDGSAVLATARGLRLLRIESAAQVETRGSVEAWAHTAQAALIEGLSANGSLGVARITADAQPRRYDPHTRGALAELELVPADRDAQTGTAVARFPISSNARLHRVGKLLVAIAQATERSDASAPRPCHVTVIDTDARPAPKKLAFLADDALCSAHYPLDLQPAFAVPNALVFARREPASVHGAATFASNVLAFFVLDLRRPSAPRWRGPYRTPAEQHAVGAFGMQGRVLYSYRVPAELSVDARYFVAYADFGGGGAPRFEPPIELPGEVYAVHGTALYAREHGRISIQHSATTVSVVFIEQGVASIVARDIDDQRIEERAYTDIQKLPDEQLVDVTDHEVLLLRAGALRRLERHLAFIH